MEVVHTRCAGMDISKKDAKVCVRIGGAGRRKTVETVTTWGSMTNQILALREHLISERVIFPEVHSDVVHELSAASRIACARPSENRCGLSRLHRRASAASPREASSATQKSYAPATSAHSHAVRPLERSRATTITSEYDDGS